MAYFCLQWYPEQDSIIAGYGWKCFGLCCTSWERHGLAQSKGHNSLGRPEDGILRQSRHVHGELWTQRTCLARRSLPSIWTESLRCHSLCLVRHKYHYYLSGQMAALAIESASILAFANCGLQRNGTAMACLWYHANCYFELFPSWKAILGCTRQNHMKIRYRTSQLSWS